MHRWTKLAVALLGAALAACTGSPGSGAPVGPPPDTAAVGPGGATRITRWPQATFQLTGTGGAVGFRCTLDGAPIPCEAGDASVTGLADGLHTFTAAAVDAAGAVDATPAVWTWTVDTVPPAPTTFSVTAAADHLEVSYPDPAADEGIQIRFGPSEAAASTYAAYATGSPMWVTAGYPLAGTEPAQIQPCQEYWVTVAVVDAAGNLSDPAPAQRVRTTPPAPEVQVAGRDGTIVIGEAVEGVEYLVAYGAAADRLDGAEATEGPSPLTVASGAALHGFPATEPRWFQVSRRYGEACVGPPAHVQRATPRPWRPVNAGPTAAELLTVACASATSCVAGGTGGVALITADGTSWAPATFTGESLRQVTAAAGALFAHGFDGLLHRSTDGGATWSLRGVAPAEGLAFASADHGYAVGLGGISRTLDGGLTWELRTASPAHAVAVVPGGERAVAASLDGQVLVSADGGLTWTQVAPTAQPLLAVTCPSASRCLVGGAGGALLVSDDAGASWASRSTGFTDAIVSLAFGDELRGWAITWTEAGQPTLRSTQDGGATWAQVDHEAVGAVAAAGPSSALVVGVAGLLQRTDDGGATWVQVGGRALVPGLQRARDVRVVAPGVILASGSAGARRSTDGGLTWSAVTYPATVALASPQLTSFGGPILGVMPAVERDTGAVRLLRTVNGGASWSLEGSGELPARVDDLACLAGGEDLAHLTCHAVVQRALYRTTDGAATWTRLSPGGPQFHAARFLDLDHGFATLIDAAPVVAGPSPSPLAEPLPPMLGLFATADGGATWTPVAGAGGGQLEVLPPATVLAGTTVSHDGGATWAPWGSEQADAMRVVTGAGLVAGFSPWDFLAAPLTPGAPGAGRGFFPWEGTMSSLAIADADRWFALDWNGVIWVTETGGR